MGSWPGISAGVLLAGVWVSTTTTLNVPVAAAAFTPGSRGFARFFLDSADVEDDWATWLPTGMFHGVTTNPLLLERAEQPCTVNHLQEMARTALMQYGVEEFMCQTWGSTEDEMYQTGMALSSLARDRIVVKVPATYTGIKAAHQLIQSGVRVCLTAGYHASQALAAVGVGAEYLAPYLGRLSDTGQDGVAVCMNMQEMVEGLGGDTRILVASIRDAETLCQLAAAGLDTFTFSASVAEEILDVASTEQAAAAFEESAQRNSS